MTRYLSVIAGLGGRAGARGGRPGAIRADDQPKVAYVVAGDAAEQPAVVARVRTLAARDGAQLRVTHTTADQLGVTPPARRLAATTR